MNVQELIAKLATFPANAEVYLYMDDHIDMVNGARLVVKNKKNIDEGHYEGRYGSYRIDEDIPETHEVVVLITPY
jgi:hypothetical protein